MTFMGAGILLAACGGSSSTTPGGDLNGTMSGTAMKGPVANATVTAFGMANGAKGAQLATAQTDSQGHFTMQLGAYAGTVLVEMHGGSYNDEATNATMSMGGADVMTSVVPGFAAGSSTTIVVTPLTSMAQAMAQGMAGGMTDANVAAANGDIGSYFSVGDILHTMPMDSHVAGSGTQATQDQKNYGMTLAAMSQYAKTIGMPVSSGIVTAMTNDASDGVMNGMMGSTPINMSGMGGMMGGNTMMSATAGTTGLATAMNEFVASGMNRSGVPMSEMQPLIDKLGASSGTIGSVATSSTPGTVSGTAVKGPVASATVSAFAVTNGAKGTQLATAQTDAHGQFTMQVGSYTGPVLIEMHGGTYTDEATGATMPMGGSDLMTSVVPTAEAGSTVAVTPLTSMAQTMAAGMPGGMTAANVTAANTRMGSYFSVGDILHTMPMDPIAAGSGAAATQDQRNYGMALAAMSQYAKTIGMTDSSGIVTAMMDDASDGVMNGMMGSTPISMSGMGGMMGGTMMSTTSGTSGIAGAMSQFVGSSMNKSGVFMAEMQPLIDKLDASSGAIQ